MKRTDFHAMHRDIHRAEIEQLKHVLQAFGGQAYFGEPDGSTDEEALEALSGIYATHTECPVIAVNMRHSEGPEDVTVCSVMLGRDDRLTIWAQRNCIDEPFELDPEEIEFGHVSSITDLIPDRNPQYAKSNLRRMYETISELSHLLYSVLYLKENDTFAVDSEIIRLAMEFESSYDMKTDFLDEIDNFARAYVKKISF